MRRDHKLFTLSIANDLVRADILFLIISFGLALMENQLCDILRNMNAHANFGQRIGHSFQIFDDSENEDVFELLLLFLFLINLSVLLHYMAGTMTTCQLVCGCI